MQLNDTRILDILASAAEIADAVKGKSLDDYLASSVLRAAVQWHVFVIGEAARQLTAEFKEKHASVPWARIIGTRNILAHQYGRIDHQVMWTTATVHVPALAAYLAPFGPTEVEE